MSAPHPHTVLFARGVIARLALWPALRLAVHASWGGPASAEKQRWLASVLVDQFEPFIVVPSPSLSPSLSLSLSAPTLPLPLAPAPAPRSGPSRTNAVTSGAEPLPDDVYVEELLLQIMADEFDVALEDDSAAPVARDVIRLFESARAGDETFVKELEVQADMVKGKVPRHEVGVGSESESGSGSDWEDEDGEGEDESEGEPVPQLLNRSESRVREEPQVDEDGFTVVKRKGHR